MSDLEATLAIWQRTSEAHAELWASHLLFALVALGFSFTLTYSRIARSWQFVFALIFLNLSIVNAWSIWDNLALYNAAIHDLQAATVQGSLLEGLMANLHSIDAGHLLAVHLILDCAILIAMTRRSLDALRGAP